MGSFIESLESRTLLSAVPAVAALDAEGKALLADTRALGKVGAANVMLIEADLKAADELKSSRSLLKTLTVEGSAAYNVTSRGVIKSYALIFADVVRLESAASHLAKHPTSATFAAKVSADENTLMTDGSNRLATITADLAAAETTNQTNFQALEAANPSNTQLATDGTNTIEPNATAARNAVSTAATTALTTDVDAVIAAFPA